MSQEIIASGAYDRAVAIYEQAGHKDTLKAMATLAIGVAIVTNVATLAIASFGLTFATTRKFSAVAFGLSITSAASFAIVLAVVRRYMPSEEDVLEEKGLDLETRAKLSAAYFQEKVRDLDPRDQESVKRLLLGTNHLISGTLIQVADNSDENCLSSLILDITDLPDEDVANMALAAIEKGLVLHTRSLKLSLLIGEASAPLYPSMNDEEKNQKRSEFGFEYDQEKKFKFMQRAWRIAFEFIQRAHRLDVDDIELYRKQLQAFSPCFSAKREEVYFHPPFRIDDESRLTVNPAYLEVDPELVNTSGLELLDRDPEPLFINENAEPVAALSLIETLRSLGFLRVPTS